MQRQARFRTIPADLAEQGFLLVGGSPDYVNGWRLPDWCTNDRTMSSMFSLALYHRCRDKAACSTGLPADVLNPVQHGLLGNIRFEEPRVTGIRASHSKFSLTLTTRQPWSFDQWSR